MVEVSTKTKKNLDRLIESVGLAELLDLKKLILKQKPKA